MVSLTVPFPDRSTVTKQLVFHVGKSKIGSLLHVPGGLKKKLNVKSKTSKSLEENIEAAFNGFGIRQTQAMKEEI